MCARIVGPSLIILALFAWGQVAGAEQDASPIPNADVPLKQAQAPVDLGFRESPSSVVRNFRAIQGLLLDHLGKPISGAQVSIQEVMVENPRRLRENYDTTDELGRFLLYGNEYRERIVVQRNDQFIGSDFRAGQTYLKLTWPAPATVRLETDLKICSPGEEISVAWTDSREGHSGPKLVQRQPADGVLTFADLTPGDYRALRKKRINVGGIELEKEVELAPFKLVAGENRSLRIGQGGGIPVTIKFPELTGHKHVGPGGLYAEITMVRTRMLQNFATADFASFDATGSSHLRVAAPGPYVLQFHRVSPRDPSSPKRPFDPPYETLSFSEFHFSIAEGQTELAITRESIAASAGSTVQFVQAQLNSKMPAGPGAMSLSGSFHRGKVRSLVEHPDRAGVVAELLRVLGDPQSPHDWRYDAGAAIAQMTETPGVVESLIDMLRDRRLESERTRYMSALSEPKRKSAEVIAELTNLTWDREMGVREVAFSTLGQIAGKQPEFQEQIAPTLIRALTDPYYHIRQRAAGTLGFIKANTAKEPLAALLEDPNPSVRLAAAQAIWRNEGNSQPILGIATALLADDDFGIRAQAANALGILESLPQHTLDALRANLGEEVGPPYRDENIRLRSAASRSARSVLEKHGMSGKQWTPDR